MASPGFDWKALLELAAPAVGGLALGSGPSQTGFQNGWLHGAELARQHKQDQVDRTQRQNQLGADYLMQIAQHAQQFDDPVALDQFLSMAETAGEKAGFTKPGDLKGKITVSPTKLASKKLQELTDQLDQIESNGYSLDDLAQSGAHLTLKDGSSIPVANAIDLTRKRPLDANNQPIAKPAKKATTEEERFLQQRAKDYGYGKLDDVDADTQLQWRQEFRSAGRAEPKPAASGGVDAQFNDLVELWKKGHPGQEPPPDVRMKLRVQAKKEIGQADDRPPVRLDIPGLTDMSPAERVETAAQAIVTKRMAPSQLATFFVGMGKDSASQLRSLVMQRVHQLQPDFNWAEAEADYQFGKAPGTQTTVRYLDNISTSIDILRKASADFARSDVNAVNKALAAGKGQLGSTDVAVYNMARNIVADEIAKVLQGGGTGHGTSDAKLRQAQELLSQGYSDKQMNAVLDAAQEMLKIRRSTLTKGTFMDRPAAPEAPPKTRTVYDMNGNPVVK